MSQKKLEQVLELFLAEGSGQSVESATELLHQIIVEKARLIYESIVDEEEIDDDEEDVIIDEGHEDVVGGEPNEQFTDEISDDEAEIESDEVADGEADIDGEFDAEFGDDEVEGSTEDRVEDLESQLADLRAEFDALMGEELQEPEHADLANDFDSEFDDEIQDDSQDFGGDESNPFGENQMYEKKKSPVFRRAPEAKKGELKKDKKVKKVDEETQFLSKVADTGQTGTAKLAGTGKNSTLGAEQTKSSFTNIPARKDYGGKPAKIGGGTGGEYGKYNAGSAENKTPTDNVDVKPKNSSLKADTTAKYTGGKSAGEGFNKSPFTKKPN